MCHKHVAKAQGFAAPTESSGAGGLDGCFVHLQRVLEAYCRKICADWHQMRFILDGYPLCMPTEMSIAQCGLRHGDVVNALVEQVGD